MTCPQETRGCPLTSSLECFMARMAAMKKVLSPISLHKIIPHDFRKPCADKLSQRLSGPVQLQPLLGTAPPEYRGCPASVPRSLSYTSAGPLRARIRGVIQVPGFTLAAKGRGTQGRWQVKASLSRDLCCPHSSATMGCCRALDLSTQSSMVWPPSCKLHSLGCSGAPWGT